jgi:hypothetical protein
VVVVVVTASPELEELVVLWLVLEESILDEELEELESILELEELEEESILDEELDENNVFDKSVVTV